MEKFVKNLKREGLPTRCWLYMLILLLSFGLPESIFAQTDLVKVTGTVTDETNQPVPGVNVLLKGSSNIGTVTDIEGKYTLNIPKDATLIFNPVQRGLSLYVGIPVLPARIREVLLCMWWMEL